MGWLARLSGRRVVQNVCAPLNSCAVYSARSSLASSWTKPHTKTSSWSAQATSGLAADLPEAVIQLGSVQSENPGVPCASALAFHARQFEQDLDFKGHINWAVTALIWLLPAAATTLLVKGLHRSADTWFWVLWQCLKAVLCYALSVLASLVIRYQLLEKQIARHLHTAQQLADSDSDFDVISGVSVHYKRMFGAEGRAGDSAFSRSPSDRSEHPCLALYHGFGANLWMWRKVQQKLADALATHVSAHDMPGFGLTERSDELSKYTLLFNGDLGRRLVSDLGKPVVLVGHSLGAAGVAKSFSKNPDGVAGIVLVAPAIMVSPFNVAASLSERVVSSDRPDGVHCLYERYTMLQSPAPTTSRNQVVSSLPLEERRPAWIFPFSLAAFFRRIGVILVSAMFFILRPVLVAALRMFVRRKWIWERALKGAYGDPSKLTEQTVYYYRLPSLVRGWELGFIRFLQTRLTSEDILDGSSSSMLTSNPSNVIGSNGVSFETARLTDNAPPIVAQSKGLLQDFEFAVKQTNVPVVIIHGEDDNLVPIGNSCRLSAVLGGAKLVKIAGAGHNVMEELPDVFVNEVVAHVRQTQRRVVQ